MVGDEVSKEDLAATGMRKMVESVPLPACLADVSGGILYANSLWIEEFGHPPADPAQRASQEASEDLYREIRQAAQAIQIARAARAAEFEVTLRDFDGQSRTFAGHCGPVVFADEPRATVLCVLVDMTDSRRREAQLAFMATHDALTGLANRRMFEDSLARSVARASRGQSGALMMIDIDNLKSYNDTLGHNQGDQALVNFALLLQTHVRAGDMLARVGGDEFGVVFDATSIDEAAEIGERMRKAAAEEAFVAEARAFELGMSAGIVPFDGSEEVQALVDAADSALYEAKEAGRNRIVVRDVGISPSSDIEARAASRIRRALHDRRFRVHYQPVVRLQDGSVAYFESLVRMLSEEGELEFPASFLPTTERLGLMGRLTRLVVDQVVETMATVSTARVSINLSGSDILDRSLPDHIEEQLTSRDVEPSRLAFEVPEHVVGAQTDKVRAWLERIRPLGCIVVLDRFSAGSRGLALVDEVPFDQVKIDVSMLARLTEESGGRAYLEALRRVVETYGLQVVASRIEDPRVLERVRRAGFGLVQGFDVGRPRTTPE